MITLCGRINDVPMMVHETSTEEEFEIIKFVENNAPFALLLGKTWIEKDYIRRKAEEEATEQKKQELRDFIARKIERLIQEDKSKQQRAREVVVEVERTQEGLKNLSMQERSVSTLGIVREGVLHLNPLKEHP
jgi:galactokinase